MTISVHRSQWTWTPVLGWALLACGLAATPAHAQLQQTPPDVSQPGGGTTSESPDGTLGPSGGLLLPGASTTGATSTGSTAPDSTSAGSTTSNGIPLPVPPSAVQLLPSSGSTIVGSPFGAGTAVPVEISTTNTSPELGISTGSFTLYPQIELNAGYDDNVFAQSAAYGTVGSFYSTVSPALILRSNWLNHELYLAASGTFGFYEAAPSQNYQNFNLGIGGKVDVQKDFYVTWSLGYNQSTEPLGSPNAPTGSAPNVVDAIPINLGVYQRFNRFFYKLSLNATRTYYYDGSPVTTGVLPGESRDLTSYDESLQLGYELTDDLSIFVTPDINQRRYLNPINAVGQQRNSDGQGLSLGASWAINGTSSINGSVGYTSQNYYDGLGTNNAFIFSLGGNWNGYEPLNLRPSITRTIQETPLSNYSSYVSTTYGVDFDWIVHDAWTMSGGLSLQTAAYDAVPGSGAVPRTDYFFRSRIGLLYTLRPQIQIGPFVEYSNGWSTDPINGPSYEREIFSIRLIAKR